MPAYFLDSSAVLKRYVAETGTDWVESLFHPQGTNQISVASICGVEVVAAISRKSRGGGLPVPDASRILRAFRSDFRRDFDVIELESTLIEVAMDLAERHGLRGYDAVQLAAALAVASTARTIGVSITFVSSDRELNAAALAEALAVDDPNDHP